MRSLLFLFLGAVLAATAPASEIVTREVSYPAGSVTARGFLAAPDGKGRHPGVLVVHEWWGLNDYARDRARALAALGYVALAVDMYGEGRVASHPKDAGGFAGAVMKDMPEARRRFEAALKFLQAQPEVDPDRIAAIGYCFGGGVVLQMAADGIPGLVAVASFHGSFGARVPEGTRPTAKMLVCHGEADSFVQPEAITDFKNHMKSAGADLTFVSYPGARHGFTNPAASAKAEEFDLDIAYDTGADQKSWAELQKFLQSALR